MYREHARICLGLLGIQDCFQVRASGEGLYAWVGRTGRGEEGL